MLSMQLNHVKVEIHYNNFTFLMLAPCQTVLISKENLLHLLFFQGALMCVVVCGLCSTLVSSISDLQCLFSEGVPGVSRSKF